MNLSLEASDRELAERAREFTYEYLIPYELECEMNNGLSEGSLRAIRTATTEWKFNAINHSVEDGGQGLDLFQQVLVQEQMGKATGALWDVVWRPAIPLKFGTEEQKETYLRPACRGERRDAYAITEAEAGSDPTEVKTSARPSGDGFVINGSKWFVTVGDVADFLLVHALVDGDRTKPTVFFVDKGIEGVVIERTPRYMHTFVFEHPEFSFTDVHVGVESVLGEIGGGYELTKDWFVEERLMIGARTVGAGIRALELATEFAAGRVQFGRAIVENQGIEFMLADMAAEIMAAKSLLYRVAWAAGRSEMDRKRLHVEAAAVKLVCSETAWRVVDRSVQIFGGRGYMREQPVERLYRDLRVDRIWEGTSEIQRLILGGELRKRGPDTFTTWP